MRFALPLFAIFLLCSIKLFISVNVAMQFKLKTSCDVCLLVNIAWHRVCVCGSTHCVSIGVREMWMVAGRGEGWRELWNNIKRPSHLYRSLIRLRKATWGYGSALCITKSSTTANPMKAPNHRDLIVICGFQRVNSTMNSTVFRSTEMTFWNMRLANTMQSIKY